MRSRHEPFHAFFRYGAFLRQRQFFRAQIDASQASERSPAASSGYAIRFRRRRRYAAVRQRHFISFLYIYFHSQFVTLSLTATPPGADIFAPCCAAMLAARFTPRAMPAAPVRDSMRRASLPLMRFFAAGRRLHVCHFPLLRLLLRRFLLRIEPRRLMRIDFTISST
jgi:hypothetical protein